MNFHWGEDHRLNVFVLGPMPSAKSLDSSCATIKKALDSLLSARSAKAVMKKAGTVGFNVEIPERLDGATIVASVFERIDAADLVVINITPKDGSPRRFSPNVFYELCLVHALGIPCLLLMRKGTPIPFYLGNSRVREVSDFHEDTLIEALREPLTKFLRNDPGTDLTANPISDFYRLPLVDISAAVGVATGYFENLVRRALLENSFIGRNDGQFRHLIVCRPPDIITHTYEEDFAVLKELVKREAGAELVRKDLPMIEGFDKRGLSGHFIEDVMIDLPTAAYTLKRSPRLQALERRTRRDGKTRATPESLRVLKQASEKLLDQFETCLRFHVDEETGFRKSALSFSSMSELMGQLRALGVSKS